jgi:hypothetical protein
MIKPEIKQMIEKDIESCEKAFKDRNGSEDLYLKLKTRYSTIDKNFLKNIKEEGKAAAICDEFDYRNELKQIKSKLETYIMLDMIPIVYEENVAEGVNISITAKKLTNKGNIGKANVQSKNKQINENGTKNTSWFKNLFTWRKKQWIN